MGSEDPRESDLARRCVVFLRDVLEFVDERDVLWEVLF